MNARADVSVLIKTETVSKEFSPETTPETLKKEFLEMALLQSLRGEVASRSLNLETFNQNLSKKPHDFKALLKSWEIKVLEDVKENPLLKKASLDLVFDRLKLERKLERLSSNEVRPFRKLWIISEINLTDMVWEDLSLAKEINFTHPLNVSWERYINENLAPKIEEVEICTESCLKFLKDWEETMPQDLTPAFLQEYGSDLWVKISFTIKKLKEKSGGRAFAWDGRVNLIEVKTKRIFASFEVPGEEKEWLGLDPKALNSSLATRIYKSPLSALIQLPGKIGQEKGDSRTAKIVVSGHRHLGEVQDLMALIKTRGSRLGLKIELQTVRSGEVDLLCFYQGEEKSFTDLLSQLKELKSNHNYVLVNELTGTHHSLKLVKP